LTFASGGEFAIAVHLLSCFAGHFCPFWKGCGSHKLAPCLPQRFASPLCGCAGTVLSWDAGTLHPGVGSGLMRLRHHPGKLLGMQCGCCVWQPSGLWLISMCWSTGSTV